MHDSAPTPQRPLRTSDFDYELPPGRIAQRPADRRDESRLLVLRRDSGAIEHRGFGDLPELTQPGDVVVLNETRVFPARLVGRKPTGAHAEILLLYPFAGAPEDSSSSRESADPFDPAARDWVALVRPGGKLKPGREVDISPELRVEILDSTPDGARIVRLDTQLPVREALARFGRMPLPPYIEREAGPEDAVRYQTVFARAEGSVAAPTAGLHFTPSVLETLERRGVAIARIVLHVGVGTFRPVDVERPAEHRMHAEWYRVEASTADALNEARAAGGALWAVGTTVARTLETVTDENGHVRSGSGWTDLFIRPPFEFHGVDRLLTNFHLPRSTLLMLVCAFGGYEPVMRAYREALDRAYRFYSYGDAMAVL